MGGDLPAGGVLAVKAAPIFDALAALHMVATAKASDDTKIPHALWLKVMHAEVGLRQALKEANLELPVDQSEQVSA